ncbi:MAG TPA: phosphatase PAP2 family protein [Devosiaceae bacterium]|jgi:undecaprenyl-diphosphatase
MTDLSKPLPFGVSQRNWLILVVIVAVVVAALVPVDHMLSTYATGWPAPVISVLAALTNLGGTQWILLPAVFMLVLSGGLAWLMRWGKAVPRLALLEMTGIWAFIFIGVGAPDLVTNLLKRIIGRGRPEVFAADGVFSLSFWSMEWDFQSFPSGHTTTAFALAMVIAFLSPRWFWPAVVVAVLVGVSRIGLGVHYASDVVAGAVIGVAGAYLVRLFFARRGWAFRMTRDGFIAPRPLVAVQRLARPRRQPRAR